jgi:ribonuclease P protein subunit RPR2
MMKPKISRKKRNFYNKTKQKMNQIAKERVKILFDEAEKNYSKHPERSHRYVELIKKIKLKYQLKLDPEIKRRLCKKCNKFMVPGKNCKIRIHNSRIIYTCNECGAIRRFGLK